MVLRFQLTEAEFSRAHRAYLAASFFSLKTAALLVFALGIGALQAQIFGGADWALRVFAGLGALLVAAMAGSLIWLPSKLFRRDPSLGLPTVIEQEEDGLRITRVEPAGSASASDAADILQWHEISRISRRSGFLLIERGSALPIAVPLSAFGSEEDEILAFQDRVVRRS